MPIGERMNSNAAEAVSVYMKLYDTASVSYGPMKIAGSVAVVIDCSITKNRLMVLVMDDKPDELTIALGNKQGADDDITYTVLPINQLSTSTLLTHMEAHFAK